ncbi:MAG: hypothetical protein GX339_02400 [Tissierellia bacterium]|nr:hypothetical protein [Tissierellia bacterium]
MSNYNKLYDKIKNNPKNISFKEIDKLLTKAGGFTRIFKEEMYEKGNGFKRKKL